jgi:hypothetical protein
MFLLVQKIITEIRTNNAKISKEAIKKLYTYVLKILEKNLCEPVIPSIMISKTSILIIINPKYTIT